MFAIGLILVCWNFGRQNQKKKKKKWERSTAAENHGRAIILIQINNENSDKIFMTIKSNNIVIA